MEAELARKLATIFYADVAGYSRLTGLDESGTHEQLCFGLDVITERIQNVGGRVVHYAGDAVLAEFESVVGATQCALGIQAAIAVTSANYPEDRRLLFRIGINVSDVIVDREELYGDGVNVAARLEQLARPGGICVSEAVHQQISGKLDIGFQDLGEQDLKNIDHPVRAYELLLDDGAVDPESDRTYQRFSAHSRVLGMADAAPLLETSGRAPASIMILPFRTIGGSEEQRALVDGFRLSIQAVLVKLSGMFIVNAPVLEAFRGRDVSAAQAGREAGIRNVLEGTVQLAGNRIRVTVQLTDAPVEQVVWSDQYDRDWGDVFELQDEITGQIVTSLGVQFTRSGDKLAWWNDLREWRDRQEALLGINHFYMGTPADNQLAREKFEEIGNRHPGTGQGFALVAATHWRDLFMEWTESPAHSSEKAVEFAEKAVTLGDPDGIGAMTLGYLRLFERRFDDALSLSQQGAIRRSSCPAANSLRATVLLYAGRPREAIDAIKHAIRAQRGAPPWMANLLSEAQRNIGEIDRSMSIAREVLQFDPENSDALAILCTDHALKKSFDEAQKTGLDLVHAQPDFSVGDYLRAKPYRDQTTPDTIRRLLRDAGLE